MREQMMSGLRLAVVAGGAYDAVFDTVISPTQQEGINEGFMVASEVATEIAEKIGPEASFALAAFNPVFALSADHFTAKELARHEDMRPYVGTLMATPALFVGGGIGYTALAEGIQAHFEGRGYDLKRVGIQTLTSLVPGYLTSGIKTPWLRAGTNQAIGSALGAGLNGGDFDDMLDAAWKGAVAGVVANRWGSGNAVLSSGLSTATAGLLNGDSGNEILRGSLVSMAVSYASSLASELEAQRKNLRQSQPTYPTSKYSEMELLDLAVLADATYDEFGNIKYLPHGYEAVDEQGLNALGFSKMDFRDEDSEFYGCRGQTVNNN